MRVVPIYILCINDIITRKKARDIVAQDYTTNRNSISSVRSG